MGKVHRIKHIVLVADLIASRKIPDRRAIQDRLTACLRRLNSKKREGLLSPYTITMGDEFQAVFSAPDRIFRDALTVLTALYPVEVRFSCAIGEINTAINTKQAIGMDGPAFHEARAMIDRLKKTKSIFAIAGPDDGGLAMINQSLALISHSVRKWPLSRLKIVVGLSEKHNVKQMAWDLRVTKTAVYKSIDAGAIKTIVSLLEEITAGLRQRLDS